MPLLEIEQRLLLDGRGVHPRDEDFGSAAIAVGRRRHDSRAAIGIVEVRGTGIDAGQVHEGALVNAGLIPGQRGGVKPGQSP